MGEIYLYSPALCNFLSVIQQGTAKHRECVRPTPRCSGYSSEQDRCLPPSVHIQVHHVRNRERLNLVTLPAVGRTEVRAAGLQAASSRAFLTPHEPAPQPSGGSFPSQAAPGPPWGVSKCLSTVPWMPPFTAEPPAPGTSQAVVASSSYKGTNPILGPHPHDLISS